MFNKNTNICRISIDICQYLSAWACWGGARTAAAAGVLGPGGRVGGDKLGWGHTQLLDKAPTLYAKVTTKAFQTKPRHTMQSLTRLNKSSNDEKYNGPGKRKWPRNEAGPGN